MTNIHELCADSTGSLEEDLSEMMDYRDGDRERDEDNSPKTLNAKNYQVFSIPVLLHVCKRSHWLNKRPLFIDLCSLLSLTNTGGHIGRNVVNIMLKMKTSPKILNDKKVTNVYSLGQMITLVSKWRLRRVDDKVYGIMKDTHTHTHIYIKWT